MLEPFDLIITHANCFDGYAAAWVAHKHSPSARIIHANYTDPAPDVDGLRVLICDFSFPRKTLIEMKAVARDLLVLDHHKTAQADLEGLDFCIFDMQRSGAGITWDTLFTDQPERPALINYIEDRDLWRFALPGSREVHAALTTIPFEFDAWDTFALQLRADAQAVIRSGEAVLRYMQITAEKFAARARRVHLGKHEVWAVNVPVEFVSETGEVLKAREPHLPILGWSWDGERGDFYCSLRSRDDGPDVSAIAVEFGGGGHEHAAGFRSKYLPIPVDADRELFEITEMMARGIISPEQIRQLRRESIPLRAGDVVLYEPTGDTFVLACDQSGAEVWPAGYPAGPVFASNCKLTKGATDDERLAMLRQVAAHPRVVPGFESSRSLLALQQLEAEPTHIREAEPTVRTLGSGLVITIDPSKVELIIGGKRIPIETTRGGTFSVGPRSELERLRAAAHALITNDGGPGSSWHSDRYHEAREELATLVRPAQGSATIEPLAISGRFDPSERVVTTGTRDLTPSPAEIERLAEKLLYLGSPELLAADAERNQIAPAPRYLGAVRISNGERYPGLWINITGASERKVELLKESMMLGLDESVWRVEIVADPAEVPATEPAELPEVRVTKRAGSFERKVSSSEVADADPDPLRFLAWVEHVLPGFKPEHHHGTSYVGMLLTLNAIAAQLDRDAHAMLAEAVAFKPAESAG